MAAAAAAAAADSSSDAESAPSSAAIARRGVAAPHHSAGGTSAASSSSASFSPPSSSSASAPSQWPAPRYDAVSSALTQSPRQPLYENHAPPYAPMEALTLAPPTPTPKSPLGVGVGVEPIYVARNGAAFKEAAPEEAAPEKVAPEEAAPEEAAPEAADAADPTSELKQILSSVASTGIPPVLTKDMIEKLLAAAAAAAAAAAEASASASASASAAPPVHEGRSSDGHMGVASPVDSTASFSSATGSASVASSGVAGGAEASSSSAASAASASAPRKSNLTGGRGSKSGRADAEPRPSLSVRFDPNQVPTSERVSAAGDAVDGARDAGVATSHRSGRRRHSSSRSHAYGTRPETTPDAGATTSAAAAPSRRPHADPSDHHSCSTCSSSSSSDDEDAYGPYQLAPRRQYGGVRISYVPNDAVALASARQRQRQQMQQQQQPQANGIDKSDKNCIIS